MFCPGRQPVGLPFFIDRVSMQSIENQVQQGMSQRIGLHPAVIIFWWGCYTASVQSLQAEGALLMGVPLLFLACVLSGARLLTLLRRTRWVMFSLLVIYGYATPGAAVWETLAQFSPTWEGLADGLLQLGRLVFALAGLAILLSRLTQQQIISGLYVLAYPLRYCGLSRERVAVRLALTLYYAESLMREGASGLTTGMEALLAPVAGGGSDIELAFAPLTLRDGLGMAAGVILLAWAFP
jgi:energy-coupling factor transporter transmembrane protein EcfT